jgi:hypothetical protein
MPRRQDRREPARGAAAAAAQPAAGDDQDRRAAGAAAAAAALRARDVAALTELYTRYGFHAALRELSGAPRPGAAGEAGRPALNLRAGPPAPAEAPDPALARKGEYECVLTRAQLGAGWRSCRPRRSSPSTPRPIRSTRCRRAWSA